MDLWENDPFVTSTQVDRPDPRAERLDYGLCVGREFWHLKVRVRLERIEADGGVDLRNLRTGALVSLRSPDGSMARTTVEWMRREYAAHRLASIGKLPEGVSERQANALLLDVDVATRKDGKARWRHSLAWRAISDEVVRTDTACDTWLRENYGRQPGDLAFARPSGSSLKRWIKRLIKGKMKIGALVSLAGRPRNFSQLEPEVDAATNEAALSFYSAGPHATQAAADAYLDELVIKLNADNPDRPTPFVKPSRQTLRLRIEKLECYETWQAKYGTEAANKKYNASGEPLLIDHVLELCLMDATELEQIVVFDDDRRIPCLKMKIVVLMDCLTHAIFGWHVYAGPNRAETSAQAVLHCLAADKFPTRMVALHPALRLVVGRPAGILPDNEKALIGPETLQGYNDAGIVVIPAPVGMPTAKAALERFFRTLKGRLAALPGTLVDPGRASELGFEAVESLAELTMHQLRVAVAKAAADHNVGECKGLPGRMSPVEMLTLRSASRATDPFEDPNQIRAALGRHFDVHLTRNGVEKDRIRYRDASVIERLFDNNAGRMGGARKAHGFTMRARRNDGDINTIEVYDEHDECWVTLPSTQPGYTSGLSFWEHEQYTEAAKRRREAFGSASARIKSMTETRRLYDEMLPKAKFRARARMAALLSSRHLAELAGKPFSTIEDYSDDVSSPTSPRRQPTRKPRPVNHAPTDADAWDDLGEEDDA